jgi:hypothetical protein
LAAAIGVIPLPAGNADRSRQQDLSSHMNRRHKAAQHAQRASVNLHTLLYFKAKPSLSETAYILAVSNEGVTVLVPRFGIEGTILLEPMAKHLNGTIEFNAESHFSNIITSKEENNIYLKVFQPVQISIKVKELNGGARSLVIGLVVNGLDYSLINNDNGAVGNAKIINEDDVSDDDDDDGYKIDVASDVNMTNTKRSTSDTRSDLLNSNNKSNKKSKINYKIDNKEKINKKNSNSNKKKKKLNK